jgi:hypothetical protein
MRHKNNVEMKTFLKPFITLLVLVMFSCVSYAGERGPGKYSGVAVFDRWNGCILYSGVYVMYVSDDVKEKLRPYAGQAVLINATKVFQPHNPGDGLIKEFGYLGPALDENLGKSRLVGLKLKSEAAFANGERPSVMMEIINAGKETLTLFSDDLAPTLLVRQTQKIKSFASPSDGPSVAVITRQAFWIGASEPRWHGEGWVDYKWTIGEANSLPRLLTLVPGQEKQIKITFDLPEGEYEFLCGYGGGVHAGRCIASNLTFFDVEKNGKGIIIDENVPNQQPVSDPKPVGLLSSKSTAEDTLFYPAKEVDKIVTSLFEEANAHIDMAEYEANTRRSLANGWTPPWQNITPNLTREECMKLPTSKLAEACFSSSLLTRYLLIHNEPIYAFSSLKVIYPCYGELFERDDLWTGVLSAYSIYASNLYLVNEPDKIIDPLIGLQTIPSIYSSNPNPANKTNKIIDSLIGLQTLPCIFHLPKMREQLKGRELLFVRAQLEALKGIRFYINGDPNEATVSSTPFFSMTAPVSLINYSLAFMKKASASQSASAINTISKLGISKKPTMGELKNYMDVCIAEIEQFLNSYQK